MSTEKLQHVNKGTSWATHQVEPHNQLGRVRLSWKHPKWKMYFDAMFERRNPDPNKPKKESILGYITPVNGKLSSFNHEGLNMNVNDIGLTESIIKLEQYFREFVENVETGCSRLKFNIVNGEIKPIPRIYKNKKEKKEKKIISQKSSK